MVLADAATSPAQLRLLLHALGGRLHHSTRCLAERSPSRFASSQFVYRVTDDGKRALRDSFQSDGRRAWVILVRDLPPVVARAKSRDAATWLVCTHYVDAFGGSETECLRRITSRKRAPWADRFGVQGRDSVLNTSETVGMLDA